MKRKSDKAKTHDDPSILTLILCTAGALIYGGAGFMIFRWKAAGGRPLYPIVGREAQAVGVAIMLAAVTCLYFVIARGLRRWKARSDEISKSNE